MKRASLFGVGLSLSLLLSTTGCQKKPETAEYFLTHPEEVQLTYERCVWNKAPSSSLTTTCEALFRVIPTIKIYLSELIASPRQFGLNLMRDQMKLSMLQAQYNLALRNQSPAATLQPLEVAIGKQKLVIESRYALLKMISNMR